MQMKEQGLKQLPNLNSSKSPLSSIKRIPEGNEENPGLAQIFEVLRRRASVIVGIAVIVTSAAYAWSSTLTESYEGKFQILVEPLKTSNDQLLVLLSKTLNQNVNEITKQNTTALDYQALMEILKSPKLINPAVQDIQTRYPEMSYGSLVGYSGSQGDKSLKFTRIAKGKDESRVIEVRYQDTDPQKIKFVLDQVSKGYLKYSVEQQQTNLRQGIKFVDQQIPKLRSRVNKLQGQLQIFQQRYGIYDPELQGAQLLKRADEIQVKQQDIQRKLAETRSLYAALQKQVGMQQNVAIAASALSESPQYQQILTLLREVEAQIATESVRLSDQHPVIQNLREQRQKLLPLLNQEAQVAVGSAGSVTANSQALGFQSSVRRDLTQQLAASASQIQSLEASEQANNQALILLNKQIKQYPVISRQYTDLERELQVANDTLTQLLAKREALRVDAAQQEVPWELIMPPTIPLNQKGQFVPLPSNAPRNIALGGIAGILLGIVAAYVIENLKNAFYNCEEVQNSTKLPVLGAIPFSKEVKKLPPAGSVIKVNQKHDYQLVLSDSSKSQQQKASPFFEAFSALYAKVQFLRSETPIRSIAVTSATNGDGKSTVAAYLAQAAAEAGQRVLLVDTDLRHPQIHTWLGLPNTKGLSEVLSQGLDLSEAIQRSPSEPNLFVLTAGQVVSNPIKLLSSKTMETLVDRLRANFDLVIYDTPHLVGLLDSHLVATHTDGTLLVVGLGNTDRQSLKQALDESKAARVPVLGVVTIGVKG